ncbi:MULTISPECIES: tRNA (adenosine(37)-N6)-threonylcarbamoyltransferase complex ATPase subunit type 1 TsaE [unclassified Treponema]|uniref:tRNA (adenosine(37)-N6)-threonylcarbamoyltransferase complex ATPase subunit type 1 TsaE n=1 Tax=unclassified Treponema TaxID=2638727 RepID=UPI0020A3219A|nr:MULTISPECIES: tRNA (adenosine(37)-N6)-threonylcarbamoyltransferase complex ATPase subunit type 1 TsaE [unclassified Treponema]UTC68154.1 tRNA (adenosine(37)-N6)-threonylcarbamoyltransferase complex ATPase subunit type 1 TsaE [Treponema sp. OMZ 789]UTC70876.1 tRNA (adenosine(37)-N6)-threonylcarbamoyltransferase complex ATPase subunit type 1 TsaE [Treponema sp. OMZ 790]UTC73616.1 tRNA (adenosine(37)-N6)-threonylcarbamoyltransferase complex ATPase subunit type 1 TsaE [Treponema sp. OMZ 791]
MDFIVKTEDETTDLGKKIGKKLKKGDVIALSGTLGAGKTYLTKGIAQGLDIQEDITSPTFTLISEYSGRLHLYHMDVYRLEGIEDFLDLGTEEMLYGEGVCVIEWSEKVKPVLPSNTIYINITINDDNSRKIVIDNGLYEDL